LKHNGFRSGLNSGFKALLPSVLFAWLVALWATGAGLPTAAALDTVTRTSKAVSLAGAEGFEPRLGTYYYTARWEGTEAFEATIEVQREDDLYRILVDSRTTGIIDFIFRIRYRGEGFLHSEDFAPLKTVITEEKRHRLKETQLYYLEDGAIEVVQTRTKKETEPRVTSHTVRPETEVLEPFSATFLARRFDWQEGEIQQFEVFTGKDTYLVTLVCQAKTIVEESGTATEAWVIRPAVRNLAKPEKKSKITDVKLYISADPYKDLLKMKSKTKAGTIILKMKQFLPPGSGDLTN
jgi:hypothetical protein